MRAVFQPNPSLTILKHSLLCFFLFFLPCAQAQDLVFYDNFEGGLGLWQTNGWGLSDSLSISPIHSFTESPLGGYPANSTLLATTVLGANLTGYLGASLEFWARWEIEPAFDFCWVEASRDGDFWVPLISLTGINPVWQHLSYDLGAFAGLPNVRLRFRFVSDPLTSMDGIYIDDLSVLGLPDDESGPLIIHRGPHAYEGTPDDKSVFAEVWDASGVSQEHLYFRVDGSPFSEAPLDSVIGEEYYHTIPAQEAGTLVEYYFTAADASPQFHTSVSDTFAYLAGRMLIQDDGVSETIYEALPGNRAAVRFQAHSDEFITSALLRLYTDSTHPLDSIGVYVWADSLGFPGTPLCGPINVFPASTPDDPEAWTWVDLRPALLTAPDSFHVGLEFAVTGAVTAMSLSYDVPPVFLLSSKDEGGGWETVVFGDFHIRTVVGHLTPDNLLPPTNLSGIGQGDLLLLNWSAPGSMDNLLRYEIERNGLLIGQTQFLETTFTDTLTGLPQGAYSYRVRARYSTGVSPFCDPWSYYWDPMGVMEANGEGVLPERIILEGFPNPTNGLFKVNLQIGRGAGEITLVLRDILGRKVADWRVDAAAQGGRITLALPLALSSGVYFLEWFEEGLLPQRLKVILLP